MYKYEVWDDTNEECLGKTGMFATAADGLVLLRNLVLEIDSYREYLLAHGKNLQTFCPLQFLADHYFCVRFVAVA